MMMYLTTGILQTLPEVSPKTQEIFFSGVRFYIKQFKEILQQSNGESLAYAIMKNIEEEQKAADLSIVKCKKGCAYCCHINVDMSLPEATIIVEHCAENNIEINTRTLAIQEKLSINERAKHSKSACVFLAADKTCKIYDVRPIACRTYLVASDPKKCDASKSTQKVSVFFEANTEMQVSAYVNVIPEQGHMSTMILKAKELIEK